MPARKLSQADLDELHKADDELLRSSSPRRIVRHADNGDEVTITTQAGIATWKGISESHFHALKRNGFRLKRGIPFEDKPPVNGTVPAEVLRATFELLQGRLEEKDRRIAELEAEVAHLRGQQP